MTQIRRKTKVVATTDAGEKTLRVTSLGGDTNPRDLIELFSREHFHVVEASVRLMFPEDAKMTEGFVTLPEREVEEAREWANGQFWRGQKLDVAVQGDDTLVT
jgi:hypothetical protein